MIDSIKSNAHLVLWLPIVLIATPYIVYTLPQYLGAGVYIVDSGSMAPEMPVGTVAYTNKDNSDLQTGDVIVFAPNRSRINEDRVIHRIINVTEGNYTEMYQTKGDANLEPDPGLTPQYQVSGERIFYIPYLGTFIRFSRSLPFIVVFVVLPAIFLIRSEMKKVFKAMDEDKKKKSRIRLSLSK